MNKRVFVDELEFEVPYGKLAAKSWHEETDECKRVLMLHGWMDNSGSFDNLAPKLKHPDGLYIVAIDLPGHGKSSQLPPGAPYSDFTFLMEVRRVLAELGWASPTRGITNGGSGLSPQVGHKPNDAMNATNLPHKKFTVIGHSLGAGLGILYSSIFPDEVENVIMLDFLKTRTADPNHVLDNLAQSIDQFIEIVPSESPYPSPILAKPPYSPGKSPNLKGPSRGQVTVSQETAIIATIEAHAQLGNLSRENATCLLKRSTVAVSTPPNSVIYSRDLRLQCMLNLREHIHINKIIFARVRCRALFILGQQGLYKNDPMFADEMDVMIQHYKASTKSCHVQWMQGDHYLHMNRSSPVSEIINSYLADPEDYKIMTEI